MITLDLPNDKELLAAFGEMALRHEHLSHILRMTIKTICRLRPDEALDATVYDGSRQLRERIRKLARRRLGEGEALLKLQALLERCSRATSRRNELMHGIWARDLDGDPFRSGTSQTQLPLPTVADLMAVTKELRELTRSLNSARLDGFLFEALSIREPGSN
jgi:hypothetical protein